MAGDNDYPLKVGMVVFTDQTTTDAKKLTIRFWKQCLFGESVSPLEFSFEPAHLPA
jgi:hypothetical protein